jgi:hypothetical protein
MNITEQAAQVLQQIDAALALAEKANTGYVHRKEEPGAVYMGNDLQQQWIEIHSVKPLDDGAFIAASRTLLPASLRCLKTAIEGTLAMGDFGHSLCAALCDQWEAAK